MKRILLNITLIAAFLFSSNLIFAQYHLTNSDFENWEGVSQDGVSGEEPNQWNSFVTMQVKSFLYKSARANKVEPSTDIRPGSKGTKSAKIWSTSIAGLGIIANGNLTTGRIYGGSMTATDATGNYNFSDPSSDSAFKHTFTGKPDSIATWLKFVPSDASQQARVSAIIHENSRYQDPEGKTYSNKVATAQRNFYPTSDKGWQRISAPFTYEGDKTPAYILVSYTTNATPGKGAGNDALYIDDAEMIYNSKANEVSFNGTTFSDFDKNTYIYYDIEADFPSSVSATVDGVSATYTTNIDAANRRITVVVSGGDISVNTSNYHTYTFNFAIPKVTVTVASANSTMGSAYIGSVGTTSTEVEKGTKISATAVANSGYMFKYWSVDGVNISSNPNFNMTVNYDMDLVATFVKAYTVTVTTNNNAYGKVTINDEEQTSISVEEGASVTLSATAFENYKFNSWKEGRKTISTEPVVVIEEIRADITYTANFSAKTVSDLKFEKEDVEYIDIDNNTFSNTASSTNSNGAISYEITEESESGVATIDSATGLVTFNKIGSITVTATQLAWGDYLETSISYSLDITPTGIEESMLDEVKVFATNGAITINATESVEYEIYNIGGALIKAGLSNGNETITINKGIYLVRIKAGADNKVERVIVK